MITRRELAFTCLSGTYALLQVVCAGALYFMPYLATEPLGHAMPGCHLTGDQLVFGATCHEIWGAQAAATLLSLPLALVLLPMAAMSLIAAAGEAADVVSSLRGAVGLFVGLSLWAPFVYLGSLLRRLTLPESPADQGFAGGGSLASSATRPRAR